MWVAVGMIGAAVVGGVMAKSNSSKAPYADPAIGAAAEANSQVAADTLEFNKKIYEENKPRQAKIDAVAEQVVNDQLAISKQNQTQAADQWDRFKTIFAPVEEQTVRDATGIDSAEELDRAAGEAAAGVQKQYGNATDQRRRSMAAMGVNPNSGRALTLESENALGLAAAKAGAANNARLVARDRGIALRAGVANFGRNMPNTAANAYTTAVTSGSNAVGNQGAGMNAANAGAAQMNQGSGVAISGNNSAGSILNTSYGNQLNAWGQQQQANAASSAGMGQMVGTLGAAYMATPSSRKVKTHKKKIDHGKTLEKVKGLPVEKWKYKKGVADGGKHTGPYAEDTKKAFGDKAAPGGKAIDIVSMNGIALSAIKGLAAKVDKLDGKVSKMAARGIRKGV